MLGKQQQDAANGSTAVQAGRDVLIINQGISVSEVRDIALDVFRANLMELRGAAAEIARTRGEEITDRFLTKLQAENPDGLAQAETPSFQHALFTVQKEYAKAGDSELGDLLVDLLVDRTKQTDRTLLQLVLAESLETAAKLTSNQIAALAIVFLLRYCQNSGFSNIADFVSWLDRHLGRIVRGFEISDSSFAHMEYAGCGTVSMGELQLETIWQRQYPGLFKTGLVPKQVQDAQLSQVALVKFLMPCLNDNTRVQVAALNEQVLLDKFTEFNVPDDERERIKGLAGVDVMSAPQIGAKMRDAAPFLANIFNRWSSGPMRNFQLTSVGMAIGHANIKRTSGEFAPLSIWVN